MQISNAVGFGVSHMNRRSFLKASAGAAAALLPSMDTVGAKSAQAVQPKFELIEIPMPAKIRPIENHREGVAALQAYLKSGDFRHQLEADRCLRGGRYNAHGINLRDSIMENAKHYCSGDYFLMGRVPKGHKWPFISNYIVRLLAKRDELLQEVKRTMSWEANQPDRTNPLYRAQNHLIDLRIKAAEQEQALFQKAAKGQSFNKYYIHNYMS